MILGQQRRMMPRPRRTVAAQAPDKVGDIIPYDYGATFDITGRPGNVVQDVINISAEGTFVAVAVGYGFEEDRGRALQLSSLIPQQGDNIPSGSVGCAPHATSGTSRPTRRTRCSRWRG